MINKELDLVNLTLLKKNEGLASLRSESDL